MAKKKIEELAENLEGKGLNDLTQSIKTEEDTQTDEISQEFIDNRNYDKYDYYEFDRKKGTVKNYIIMFALYAIVIALVVLLIIGFKYRETKDKVDIEETNTYETQN